MSEATDNRFKRSFPSQLFNIIFVFFGVSLTSVSDVQIYQNFWKGLVDK